MQSLDLTMADFKGEKLIDSLQQVRTAAEESGVSMVNLMGSTNAAAVNATTGSNFEATAKMVAGYYTDAAGEAETAYVTMSGSIANQTQAVMTYI